jgi:hypothetical protein
LSGYRKSERAENKRRSRREKKGRRKQTQVVRGRDAECK